VPGRPPGRITGQASAAVLDAKRRPQVNSAADVAETATADPEDVRKRFPSGHGRGLQPAGRVIMGLAAASRRQFQNAADRMVVAHAGRPRQYRGRSGAGPTDCLAGVATVGSNAGVDLGPAERRLLAQMPLHAITSVHGQAGLAARLMLDLAAFSPADRNRVEQALGLASRLHARDRRQREPYLNHLLRVAIRIISHYRVSDPDVVCAALLHDAVEDRPGGLAPGGGQQEALAALAGQFGERAARPR